MRPRGRGQRVAILPPQPLQQSTDISTTSAALLAATATALLQNHRRSRSRSRSPSYSQRRHHRSHSRSRSRSRHRHSRHSNRHSPSLSSSPLKVADPSITNLHDCLEDFHTIQGHDFRMFEDKLIALAYTPDLIPDATNERVADMMECAEGLAVKFKKFCVSWVEKKNRSLRRRV